MQISSEDIKAILVQNGFEPRGDDFIITRGLTEFMATVKSNRVDIFYHSGPASGDYSLEVYSPEFPSMLEHIFAETGTKTRAAMQHWRL